MEVLSMIIRPIELADAEGFIELSKKIDESNMMLFEPGERTTTTEQQKASIERIVSEERTVFFVAESEGELLGFIAAMGSDLKRTRHSATIVLGVLEEYRGQGIASQLFNRVFEWAKEVGITRLGLTVIKENSKAFNLYRKMGFAIEGEKVHSLMINSQPVNEYYLYKLV